MGMNRVLALGLLAACAHAPSAPRLAPLAAPDARTTHEATGQKYVVSTQGHYASLAAKRMFDAGGNIMDAAVAASFAISVERPHSTGIGGGGFLLFRSAKDEKILALDFRETAPAGANEKMYLGARGEVIPRLSTEGILSVAVPGLVAGLLELHQKYGQLPLRTVMAPAVELAENGFAVYPELARALEQKRAALARYPASKAIFLRSDGEAYRVGERLVQRDLGATLRLIAQRGSAGFYAGRVGAAIARESRRLRGVLRASDLAAYRTKWREPVHGTFRGYDIYSMPPPSSGGVHVIEILNVLENAPLAEWGAQSAASVGETASAMQQAFADRARYLGDPDFVRVPAHALVSKDYARDLFRRMSPERARDSDAVAPGDVVPFESSDTTHFSIIDGEGNMISTTQTINGYMGSSVVVPGTGVLLNDEMDDFSAKPGASNMFGAIGGEANSIRPGKRPLSSMSPTIVLRRGVPVLAVGAPGGTHILTCVALTLLNYLEYKMPLWESLAAIRYHDQWRPDELEIDEPGFNADVMARLRSNGYRTRLSPSSCRVLAVAREESSLRGVSDPRGEGSSVSE